MPLAVDPALGARVGFVPQGISADLIATLHGFSRTDVDTYALASQERTAAAHMRNVSRGRSCRSSTGTERCFSRATITAPRTTLAMLGALVVECVMRYRAASIRLIFSRNASQSLSWRFPLICRCAKRAFTPPAIDQTCKSCTSLTPGTRRTSRTSCATLRSFGVDSMRTSTVSRMRSRRPLRSEQRSQVRSQHRPDTNA